MARKGKGRQKRLADMRLPPDQRGRHKTTRTSRKPLPAQLQHGNSPAGRRKKRDGERKLDQARPDLSGGA
jgi:hypothetical protein